MKLFVIMKIKLFFYVVLIFIDECNINNVK